MQSVPLYYASGFFVCFLPQPNSFETRKKGKKKFLFINSINQNIYNTIWHIYLCSIVPEVEVSVAYNTVWPVKHGRVQGTRWKNSSKRHFFLKNPNYIVNLYYFQWNTPQSGVIFHKKCKMGLLGSPAPPPTPTALVWLGLRTLTWIMIISSREASPPL